MSHSPVFHSFARLCRSAIDDPSLLSRRQLLRGAAAFGASMTLRAANRPDISVGIVGAGLAGLACAYELKKRGIKATVYEASERNGGRCRSLSGLFPGQVTERGGEYIDTLHTTARGYAREFGLAMENVSKFGGEVCYSFRGEVVSEARVVEEFRAFVPAMQRDLRALSKEPAAAKFTPMDQALDRMSLREYLQTRGAGPIAHAAIEQAYVAEYGLSPEEQSCLNFLLFMHADRRSKFTPFGVFSDERYHVLGGNDAIASGLASRVEGQTVHGRMLTAVRRLPSGRIRLTFARGAAADHDAVVLAIPFTTLRTSDLTASGLPEWKLRAIRELGYGTNAKLAVGFRSPFWRALGSNGSSYSDRPNHQTTWETNPSKAGAHGAVLTDYSGGMRGAMLNPADVQTAASAFLGDLNATFPGALANAARSGSGAYLAHLEHWPSNPLIKGSYTCYRPGQFTTIAGLEGRRVENILFAGEHANSFYEWQGFMEGALLSGVQAARDIVKPGK